MAIILPILTFLFLTLAINRTIRNGDSDALINDFRYAGMLSTVCLGVFSVAAIELLSLFSALTFWNLTGAWLTVLIASVAMWCRSGGKISLNLFIFNTSRDVIFLGAGIILLAAVVGFVAIYAPPNTWDSLTYHMSRVAHWAQNRSVSHYPTNILRQLYHAPGNEFMILHAQILSGGDRFANIIQWFFYTGCIAGTSFVAKQLGVGKLGQVMTAVFSSTLPMAILQASSTQSDLAVSFWLITSVSFLLQLRSEFSSKDAFGAGASLGLAFLTKALAYVYALPFLLLWVGIALKRKTPFKQLLTSGIVMLVLIFIINIGYLARNYRLFHQPLGPIQTINLTNEEMGVAQLASNLIRSAASHTSFPIVKINHELTIWIYKIHRWIGIDPNNPKITYDPNFGKFQVRPIHAHEDSASNPIHFWLIVLCLGVLIGSVNLRRKSELFSHAIATLAAFILSCFIFKWQVWISRLQLPLFFLWAPVSGFVITMPSRRWVSYLAAIVLLVCSLYWALFNFSRSLLKWPFRNDMPPTIFESDRELILLNNGSKLVRISYFLVVKFIQAQGYKNVGLLMREDDWEYPFWAILNAIRESIRIEHVGVENVSSVLSERPFVPDVVIATQPSADQIKKYENEVGPVRQLGILWVFGHEKVS